MMHTYLRTIGFSELKNRAEVEKLLSKVVKEATERRILKILGLLFVENMMKRMNFI